MYRDRDPQHVDVPIAGAGLSGIGAAYHLQRECPAKTYAIVEGYCVARNRDPSITLEPFIDFSSGYVVRSIDQFPKQGSKAPWRL